MSNPPSPPPPPPSTFSNVINSNAVFPSPGLNEADEMNLYTPGNLQLGNIWNALHANLPVVLLLLALLLRNRLAQSGGDAGIATTFV